jgi:hypothetical protein
MRRTRSFSERLTDYIARSEGIRACRTRGSLRRGREFLAPVERFNATLPEDPFGESGSSSAQERNGGEETHFQMRLLVLFLMSDWL